jgi:ribosomal protein S18 acetylase RimI-like enzyme
MALNQPKPCGRGAGGNSPGRHGSRPERASGANASVTDCLLMVQKGLQHNALVVFFELLVWFYLSKLICMSNSTLPIRVATSADAAAITAVINAAFRIAEGFFIESKRITEAEVEESLEKGAFLLAENAEKLNGCVYVEMRGTRSYLGLLSVDPECQQGGIGSLLMNEAERYCRERGSQFMDILIVHLREDLPSFYKKRGYTEDGTSPFPADVKTLMPVHFINMSKRL